MQIKQRMFLVHHVRKGTLRSFCLSLSLSFTLSISFFFSLSFSSSLSLSFAFSFSLPPFFLSSLYKSPFNIVER